MPLQQVKNAYEKNIFNKTVLPTVVILLMNTISYSQTATITGGVLDLTAGAILLV